jgi:hypothetical protein
MNDSLPSIEFESDHLLSKWGFDDGDLLIPVLKNGGFPEIDDDNDFWIHFNRLVLCEVVECFVCTQIDNQIKPYRCSTSHNPIRVYEIDGKHVSELKLSASNLILQPFSVSVTESQILSTAQQLYEQKYKFKDQNNDWSYMIPSDFAIRIRREYGWD